MTVLEIAQVARNDFLDDDTQPPKWNDVTLARNATQAEQEACRRASLLLDSDTQTADNITNGVATSTVANKLSDSGATFTDAMVGKTVYNPIDNTWAVITAKDSTILLSLSADIMTSGEAYVIGDASKALCRVCVTSGVGNYNLSHKITKIESCYLESMNGVPLHQKTRGWLDRHYFQWRTATGTPRFYLEERGKITLVPKPDSTFNNSTGKDTLNLSVYRLPLLDLDVNTNNSPEIPEEYHYSLIDYICYLCYSNQNSDSQDLQKSTRHLALFEAKFGVALNANAESILKEIPSSWKLEKQSFGL